MCATSVLLFKQIGLLFVLFCHCSIENYLAKKWTLQDVEQAEVFFATHNAGFTPFPYPKDLFIKVNKDATPVKCRQTLSLAAIELFIFL